MVGSRYTGEQEWVSIEQVIAAEGPREPPPRRAQSAFNAGFVYLLEPGKTPDPDMLRLHAEHRDKVIEHWSHVTGGRSEMATTVPAAIANPTVRVVPLFPSASDASGRQGFVRVINRGPAARSASSRWTTWGCGRRR